MANIEQGFSSSVAASGKEKSWREQSPAEIIVTLTDAIEKAKDGFLTEITVLMENGKETVTSRVLPISISKRYLRVECRAPKGELANGCVIDVLVANVVDVAEEESSEQKE